MPDAYSQEPRARGQHGVLSTNRPERPEIVVRPKLNRAADQEVTIATLGELMRTDVWGGFDSPLPQLAAKTPTLLVEHAVLPLQERGLPVINTSLDACHKRDRLSVMVTVVMIASMLSIALRLGANASFSHPMAIAVIGWLITSTLLSLGTVPAVFSFIHDFAAGSLVFVGRHAQRTAWRTVRWSASRAPSHPWSKGASMNLFHVNSRALAITPSSTQCWASLSHRARWAALK